MRFRYSILALALVAGTVQAQEDRMAKGKALLTQKAEALPSQVVTANAFSEEEIPLDIARERMTSSNWSQITVLGFGGKGYGHFIPEGIPENATPEERAAIYETHLERWASFMGATGRKGGILGLLVRGTAGDLANFAQNESLYVELSAGNVLGTMPKFPERKAPEGPCTTFSELHNCFDVQRINKD